MTFVDPIIGEGALVKRGKGALVLGTDACAIDELRLEGGTMGVAENLRSSKWADVMSVNKVTGDLVAADGVKFRFIEETSTLQAKIATGMILMVR